MKFLKVVQDTFTTIQIRFKESSVDNIIWWINLTPQWAGFSITTHKNSVLFWIIHFVLLLYLDFFGNFVHRIILSEDANGVLKASTNLSIIVVTANISVWFITKRTSLIRTIVKLREIDKLSSNTMFLNRKHRRLLRKIKIFVVVFNLVNFANIFIIWLPQRMNLSSSVNTSQPCPGLNITIEINKHICRASVFAQDATVAIVIINYQTLLLFFIAHTAGMYTLLSEEMLALNAFGDFASDKSQIKDKLVLLILQHILLLDMVQQLKILFNTSIGVDILGNGFCICFFFTLSLQEWSNFAPLLTYSFFVFFLYCFLWQKLIDTAEGFERSVYACGWEKYDLSEKKNVYIILLLAQKPPLLLAGDIVPIHMKTFANAMRLIYKFVTAFKY